MNAELIFGLGVLAYFPVGAMVTGLIVRLRKPDFDDEEYLAAVMAWPFVLVFGTAWCVLVNPAIRVAKWIGGTATSPVVFEENER